MNKFKKSIEENAVPILLGTFIGTSIAFGVLYGKYLSSQALTYQKTSEENFPLIIEEMHIPLDAVMESRKKSASLDAVRPMNYYFIPDYITKFDRPYNSWVLLEETYFFEEFAFDMDRIKTRFVTITRK